MLKKIGTLCVMLTLATLLIVAGCGGGKNKNKDGGTPADKPVYKSNGDEGTISGKVNFDGTPPTPKKIDMSQDANCAAAPGEKTTDDVVVTGGKLANVFVYVKGGPVDTHSFPTPLDAVILDQQGCRYHPRVLGIQVNQTFSSEE